jgi:molecular chaperone DnaK
MATGKDQKITITSSSGLSKQDIERMAKEAESHATDDKIRREQIEAKNQLDSMVYNVEKMLRDQGDKISGSERGEVENSLADAKRVLDSADKHQMDEARERLTHKLAEHMYSKAQPQSTSGAGPSVGGNSAAGRPPKRDEGVIDAEYTDVEEKTSA